jgi:hypothetical protein
MKTIPAPIDEKNVCTDWIEEIFDYQSCLRYKKRAVGFVDEEPVIASWEGNLLTWKFPVMRDFENSISLAYLKEKLERYSEYNPELVEHYNVVGDTLEQRFYWRNED